MKIQKYLSAIGSFIVSFLIVTGMFQVGIDIPLENYVVSLGSITAIGAVVTLLAIAAGYILKEDEITSSINGFCASAGTIGAMLLVVLPETTYKIIVPLVIAEFVLVGFFLALGVVVVLRDLGLKQIFQSVSG